MAEEPRIANTPGDESDDSSPEVIEGRIVGGDENEPSSHLMMVESRAEFYSGPLPSPKVLAEYERILPGAADRLFALAEKQQDHRLELEKAVVYGNIKADARGTYTVAFVMVSLSVLAGYLALHGMGGYAISLVLGAITVVGGVSYANGRRQSAELKEKKKLLESGKSGNRESLAAEEQEESPSVPSGKQGKKRRL